MRNFKNYKLISLILALAFILSACSGVPGSGGANGNDSDPVVTFTGVVESMGAGQWTINGQAVNVTGATSVDANIVVGDTVTVEAVIDQGGVLTAVKIEISGDDNDNSNDNGNSNGNSNGNDNSSDNETEVIGVVDAITSASLTIDGVVYQIASFTEFKDEIAVGDQVKAHVIVNADGTLTLREVEKFSGDDNDNGSNDNTNLNSNDNSNSNTNTNLNSNDDNSNSGGGNSNDDDDDDNSGSGNDNDDDDDDDDGNDND